MIIAIDFDGTIVEHRYPAIGREIPFAFDTLKALQKKGHRIILWTRRYGDLLDEVVDFCRERGVEFYAVNRSFPEEKDDFSAGRKISADIYIDDCNLGGLPSWGEIFRIICPEEELDVPAKKRWWKFNKQKFVTGRFQGF